MKNMPTGQQNAIETENLRIKENIMLWDSTMIQLSNVCSIVSNTYIRTVPFPMMSLGLVIIGFVLCMIPIIQIIGIVSLVVGILWILFWILSNINVDKTITLDISMNSGEKYRFKFADEKFKNKVWEVLYTIISQKDGLNIGEISIDVKNSTIGGNIDFLNKR